jgi:hypothetical protein
MRKLRKGLRLDLVNARSCMVENNNARPFIDDIYHDQVQHGSDHILLFFLVRRAVAGIEVPPMGDEAIMLYNRDTGGLGKAVEGVLERVEIPAGAGIHSMMAEVRYGYSDWDSIEVGPGGQTEERDDDQCTGWDTEGVARALFGTEEPPRMQETGQKKGRDIGRDEGEMTGDQDTGVEGGGEEDA